MHPEMKLHPHDRPFHDTAEGVLQCKLEEDSEGQTSAEIKTSFEEILAWRTFISVALVEIIPMVPLPTL